MNIFPSILRNLLLLIFAFLNTIGFAQKDIKIEIDNLSKKEVQYIVKKLNSF